MGTELAHRWSNRAETGERVCRCRQGIDASHSPEPTPRSGKGMGMRAWDDSARK
ncbi:hypothetical protein [Halovivax gelatinilyticus]|uniref:hypothetical protein n=1 Tax=Halovivax gelatinilyticus TaxID=2961597 RepID=UPI0020CA328F|nr:hypothetical protein [Halovivax gelatinilyticus]